MSSVWLVQLAIGNGGESREQAQISTISHQDLEAFSTAGRNGGEALVNVLMMSGFWGKDQYRYVDLTDVDSGWGRSFVLLLPLLLWGVYAGLKKPQNRPATISLLVVFAVSVALAVGMRLPVTREVTIWLFDNVPFYKGLRETQKWVAVIVVIYSIFLALGLRQFFQVDFISKNRFSSLLFLAGAIIMQAPLLLWGLGGQVTATEYPADWKLADEKIVELSDCGGQTLFLPWHLYMSFDWIGQVVATPGKVYFSCPTVISSSAEWGNIDDTATNPVNAAVSEWILSHGRSNLLSDDRLDIRYMLVAKEVDWQAYEWLSDLSSVELVEDWSTIKLYEVKR
jgi:hypothetical protein